MQRVQYACGTLLAVGLVIALGILSLTGPELLQRMLFRAQRGILPGARLNAVQTALDDLVAHLNDEVKMDECVKSKMLEVRRLLKQGTCAEPSLVPAPSKAPTEQPHPLSVGGAKEKDDVVSLSADEQEFVRRLLRISGKPLTKNQAEALAAVKASNRELYDTLSAEVAAETGEYRLPDTMPEGLSGTAGIGGQGLPAWDRKLALDPVTNNAIFVALVTYRDPQCPQSLVEAFARASQPSRVFIGVVQQVLSFFFWLLLMLTRQTRIGRRTLIVLKSTASVPGPPAGRVRCG